MEIRKSTIILAVLVLALLAPAAWAQPVGTFTKVEGGVDILRRSDIVIVPVRTGDPVSMGDAIRTRRNGKAEIQFRDETVVQIAPETRITIDQYSYRGADQRERGFLSLFRGKLRAIVSKAKAMAAQFTGTASSFSIKTPTAIAGVKGTQLIVYYDRGVTGAIFLDGQGFLYNPDRPERVVPVRGGQASFVMSRDEPPLDAQPVPESFVAPYLRDFPGTGAVTAAAGLKTLSPAQASGRGVEAPGLEKEGVRRMPLAGVVGANTTYQALVDNILSAGPLTTELAAVVPPLLINQINVPVGPPGGVTTLVPVTETNPQLLPTPVTVTVTLP